MKALADAAEACWNAILARDVEAFGKHFTASFDAQIAKFPAMCPASIAKVIEEMKPKIKGYKLSGAGGGGYLIMISDKPVENAFQIKIRRKGKE
jgi:galactokinase/mevalonate kinase-like predicted kinase